MKETLHLLCFVIFAVLISGCIAPEDLSGIGNLLPPADETSIPQDNDNLGQNQSALTSSEGGGTSSRGEGPWWSGQYSGTPDPIDSQTQGKINDIKNKGSFVDPNASDWGILMAISGLIMDGIRPGMDSEIDQMADDALNTIKQRIEDDLDRAVGCEPILLQDAEYARQLGFDDTADKAIAMAQEMINEKGEIMQETLETEGGHEAAKTDPKRMHCGLITVYHQIRNTETGCSKTVDITIMFNMDRPIDTADGGRMYTVKNGKIKWCWNEPPCKSGCEMIGRIACTQQYTDLAVGSAGFLMVAADGTYEGTFGNHSVPISVSVTPITDPNEDCEGAEAYETEGLEWIYATINGKTSDLLHIAGTKRLEPTGEDEQVAGATNWDIIMPRG